MLEGYFYLLSLLKRRVGDEGGTMHKVHTNRLMFQQRQRL